MLRREWYVKRLICCVYWVLVKRTKNFIQGCFTVPGFSSDLNFLLLPKLEIQTTKNDTLFLLFYLFAVSEIQVFNGYHRIFYWFRWKIFSLFDFLYYFLEVFKSLLWLLRILWWEKRFYSFYSKCMSGRITKTDCEKEHKVGKSDGVIDKHGKFSRLVSFLRMFRENL
jgi:hypothetical protein